MRVFAGLKLYPNGFLGVATDSYIVKNRDLNTNLIGFVENKISLRRYDGELISNPLVDSVYKKAVDDPGIVEKSFGYRERLYLTAFSVFGTETIQDWIHKQSKNPYFDSMQNRFMNETIEYVLYGKRLFHVNSYLNNIIIGQKNDFSVNQTVKDGFKNIYDNKPVLIEDFVKRWVRQENGCNDLIMSLRIFFGD